MSESRIVVALDFDDSEEALALVDCLAPSGCRLKVGKQLFTAAGPAFVARLVDRGLDVFLDLKFHDIPNTVAGACRAAARLGVWMLNVHALGGRANLSAARDAVSSAPNPPLLIAVTVLTSLDEASLRELGFAESPIDLVLRLSSLAEDCNLDGVVCSAREVEALRRARRAEFLLVTPGIRPRAARVADQKRVLTPGEAVSSGADYLVVGRPITAAPDPLAALRAIRAEIGE